ncbi:MAG: M81 family metallopeptidase [Alphaproteobacteria bacterium]|nr:M81 family metallopeptidase [Alphaproteobacteria bacterium]
MRVVMAMMKHETNTFSPVPTPWSRFEEWSACFGDEVIRAYEPTNMTLSAYIKLCRDEGAEIVSPIAAEAMPSGPVAADAYERMSGAILEAVAKGCDAIMLDLHGAMVAEVTPDGEGTLLVRIREIAPETPICVTCDLHCNLTQAMVDNCDALIGYKTYPHTDMYEVGTTVGRILLAKLKGKADPVMAWGRMPLLSQTLRQGTDDEPFKSLVRLTREAEAAGEVLAATVFGGFALADIHDAGISAVAIADGDRGAAERVVERLNGEIWSHRDDHLYRHEPLEVAVARAKAIEDGPVILLDHADNTGSGGNQDVMTVIAEVMRQGLEDVAVGGLWDPDAVQRMMRAGIGATVTLELGGRTDMPSIGLTGEPLVVTGKVRVLTDGEWVVRGPMYHGLAVSMGPTAVLDTGKMQIVVVSRHHEPWDLGIFLSVGIDPAHKRYVLLKSRIHYRAGFAPIAKHTITLDGTGVTTSDNSLLDYQNVRRPIYPLDRINEPEPQ